MNLINLRRSSGTGCLAMARSLPNNPPFVVGYWEVSDHLLLCTATADRYLALCL